MNILPAGWFAARGQALPDGLPAGADLIGMRPDDLTLAAPPEPHLTLPATLELLEPAGAESHLYLRLDGFDTPLTQRSQGRPALSRGRGGDPARPRPQPPRLPRGDRPPRQLDLRARTRARMCATSA